MISFKTIQQTTWKFCTRVQPGSWRFKTVAQGVWKFSTQAVGSWVIHTVKQGSWKFHTVHQEAADPVWILASDYWNIIGYWDNDAYWPNP